MIRAMKRDDTPDIMRIWIEGNLDAHDFIDGDYWRGNYAAVLAELPKSQVFVFEERGEITGFIGLKGSYVAGLFVDRRRRGHGVGRALLNRAKKLHSELSLHAFEKNAGAVRFYLREGFAPVGRGSNSDAWERELLLRWKK